MPITSKNAVPFLRLVAAATAAALGLVAATLPARALDIGFGPIDVNVQGFANTGIKHMEVDCLVRDANGAILPTSGFAPLPGYPGVGELNAAGSFAGKLGAGLFLKNPADVANAKTFKCDLRGFNGSSLKNLEIGDGSEWWHVKSGVLSVSGPIN